MECLAREGVEHIFGYPGGANLPLYDTLPQYPQIRHILVRHEQAAAHAADAYARVTGKAGVCWATSGPGATNLVTGIANAWMDSVPLVCITGAVQRRLIGRDGFRKRTSRASRCRSRQTIWCWTRTDRGDDREAFHIATTGRPGRCSSSWTFAREQTSTGETVEMPNYRPVTKGNARRDQEAELIVKPA
jgi:acetolactate synthase-1/2/3 large subunit